MTISLALINTGSHSDDTVSLRLESGSATEEKTETFTLGQGRNMPVQLSPGETVKLVCIDATCKNGANGDRGQTRKTFSPGLLLNEGPGPELLRLGLDQSDRNAPWDGNQRIQHLAAVLINEISAIRDHTPASARHAEIAITNIENAAMWAKKAWYTD